MAAPHRFGCRPKLYRVYCVRTLQRFRTSFLQAYREVAAQVSFDVRRLPGVATDDSADPAKNKSMRKPRKLTRKALWRLQH
tara:strand:- start:27881 stop:28123 length:243 start_codon:yes stop_codon:yes gene_type:complete